MKRFLLALLVLLALLALAAPCIAQPVDNEANVPTWAQQIRDTMGAEYMAVYAHHGMFSRHKERSEKFLERTIGDFSRETSYFYGKVVLSVMTWDRGGALTYKEMRELQWNYREAVSRYYLKFWPK